jgi:hypothetical protein
MFRINKTSTYKHKIHTHGAMAIDKNHHRHKTNNLMVHEDIINLYSKYR